MSSRLATLVVVLGAGILGSCGASSGHSSTPVAHPSAHAAACPPHGSVMIVASRQARVFRLGSSVYGCSEQNGRRWLLGSAGRCIGTDRAGPFALSGDLVGYALERCGVDTGSTQVVARSLRDGRRLRSAAAIRAALGPETFVTVDAIVISPHGSLAWIASAQSLGNHRQAREVARAAGSGARTLDSGPAIAVGSLTLREAKLTWRHGRMTRSAALP